MVTAKVLGAGSIGNHLSYALRYFGVDVTIVDVDPKALERTKSVIYPERYGEFDEQITLALPQEIGERPFDLCVIGTPPDTHLSVATQELFRQHRVLLIEKPLAPRGAAALRQFSMLAESSPTRVLVAYNQRLKLNTIEFLRRAEDARLGSLLSISARMKEDWSGILRAHPWLDDATESYLGHTNRGGGALYEHSHATDFALFIASALGQGRPERVKAKLDVVEHSSGRYDRKADLIIETATGLAIDVVQDLFTWPAEKFLVAGFTHGELSWEMGSEHDLVRSRVAGEDNEIILKKTRQDDFVPEIRHVLALIESGEIAESPLDLRESLYTSWTLEAAVESDEVGSWVGVRPSTTDNG